MLGMKINVQSLTHHITIIRERNPMTNDIRIRHCHFYNLFTIRKIDEINMTLTSTSIEIKGYPLWGGAIVKYGIINATLFINFIDLNNTNTH